MSDPYGYDRGEHDDERADWGWLHGITDPDVPTPEIITCPEHGRYVYGRDGCPTCLARADADWAHYRYLERVRRTS